MEEVDEDEDDEDKKDSKKKKKENQGIVPCYSLWHYALVLIELVLLK